ncbi:uncharacterized protein LOC133193273 [Saccostrea echinata]|uniref:uncharacterized protein LOC133193273 n=1 Tax=Saccostrea echinata TaxID=191078 RepID=UPI002A808352|nr:uncharacterized protein LOC133193273 [Saccostrea echinata]
MTWRKEVINNLIRYDPAVTLLCNFSLKSDEELFYDVTWFIDGQEAFSQTVDFTNNYTAVIKAHDMLRAKKKIGSDVHCKVGAKRKKENSPCLFKVGNPFFAGIKILNPSIELERKGSKNVELEMTIPFASESLYINGDLQPVSDLNIHMTFKTDDPSKCSGGGSSNQCEVKVKSYNYNERHKYENGEWRQNISFPVYSQDTDAYVINSQMTLRLKTGGTNGVGSKIFEHVSLPDISISVREGNEQWKGRSCSVRADPHMYTFDGKSYECQIPGEFINYRSQHQLQWIQSKHHLCFPSYDGPWCVCAVAARAGRDVFVIDLCGENKIIGYELCEDNVLKVTKIHDKYYKVYFPTGTSLAIYIMEWNRHYIIDLEILPSAMDVGNADGLCGYFDGVRENDFRRRNSTIIDDIGLLYPNDFSESWKILDNENLFSGDSLVYSSLQSVSTILVPHCTCTESGKTQCSYNTFTPCNSNRGKQYTCNVDLVQNRRRKRDVSDMYMQRDPLIRKKRTMSYVRSTEYSETVCLQAFENSREYNTCQQYVTDLSNVTLSNCIEDIRMTGDNNLTQIHVEAALQQCSTFVLLNATLQESEPEVTYTIQNLCPSNCTGHGTCDGVFGSPFFYGNCTCDANYGGSDCSFDLLGPPTITSVPGAGLCDLSTTTCKEATIMGKYFFENMDSIYYLTVKQNDINQTEEIEHKRQMNLQERTLFEGFCPLPYDTSGIWMTEIKFNISNDGVRFTDTYQVIIYQSHCQEYHNESGNVYFTLKDNYCYIDSTCIRPMQNSSINECLYCNATNDKFNWTENESCGQTTTESMSTTMIYTDTVSALMSSTEQIEEITTSITTVEQDETTYFKTTASFTTAENEQTSLVSDSSSVDSTTLLSTMTMESIQPVRTTESSELTEETSTNGKSTAPSTTTISEAESTASTYNTDGTEISFESVDTTTSIDTKDAKEGSTPAKLKNTYLIVGASTSVVGIVLIMTIIGLVARKCSKSRKHQGNQQENNEPIRNWRDLVWAGKPTTSPQYNTNSSLPYTGKAYVPHAPLHHFKSSGGSRNINASRYQRY